MESKIKKMYSQDCRVIFMSMMTLWIILVYGMVHVSAIAPNHTIRMIVFLVGTTAWAFGTASSIDILVHLKKNQRVLYMEEIISYEHKPKHS